MLRRGHKSVLLVGPRQTGKSTLAGRLAPDLTIDLAHEATYLEFARQQGDALYYASYFAGKTFNPFVAYPILAIYFILLTLTVTAVFGWVNRRLNRHLPQNLRSKLRFRPQLVR